MSYHVAEVTCCSCFSRLVLRKNIGAQFSLIKTTVISHKTFPKDCKFLLKQTFKMSDAKRIKLSVNFNSLPPEMVERILKLLNLMELCQARLICKRWREIIDKGNLVKDAAGNDLSRLPCTMITYWKKLNLTESCQNWRNSSLKGANY